MPSPAAPEPAAEEPETNYSRDEGTPDALELAESGSPAASSASTERCEIAAWCAGCRSWIAKVVEPLERRRYSPALLAGRPVEVEYLFRVELRLP